MGRISSSDELDLVYGFVNDHIDEIDSILNELRPQYAFEKDDNQRAILKDSIYHWLDVRSGYMNVKLFMERHCGN